MTRVAMRLMCLWPGLPQLWWRGQTSWLLVALAFAVLLNLAVAASFLFPGLLPPLGVLAVWSAVVVTWGVSVWRSQQHWERIVPTTGGGAVEDLFRAAQTQYLRGNWDEVETLAAGVLQQHPDDVEFRLLLASAQRRIGKCSESRATLLDALQWEGGETWKTEIQRELARLRKDSRLSDGEATNQPLERLAKEPQTERPEITGT